jgi:phage terminase small subunit
MRKRWQLFAEEWAKNWNATDAYVKAYPNCKRTTAGANGHKLLKNAEIVAYINEHQMKPEEIVGRLEEQARNEHGKFISANGNVDLAALKEAGKEHLIKGITYDRRGNVIVHFYDASRALEMLGRHQKMFTDKTEVELGDRLAAKLDKYADVMNKIYGNSQPDSPGEVHTDGA